MNVQRTISEMLLPQRNYQLATVSNDIGTVHLTNSLLASLHSRFKVLAKGEGPQKYTPTLLFVPANPRIYVPLSIPSLIPVNMAFQFGLP
jgi:hypothetical protein